MVVERTIESSTRKTRFPSSTSRNGVYLVSALLSAAIAPFDERAARIAIADQAFARGNAQLEGHRVGRRFARVGHGNHDRVLVQRNRLSATSSRASSTPKRLARQVDAAIVQRTGHIGKVDPLEETVGTSRRVGETVDIELAVDDGDRPRRAASDLMLSG